MIIMKSSEEAKLPSITCCRLQVPRPAFNYEVGIRSYWFEEEGSSNTIRRVYRRDDDALTTGRYFVKEKASDMRRTLRLWDDGWCFEWWSEVGVPCRDWSEGREMVGLHPWTTTALKRRAFVSWSRGNIGCVGQGRFSIVEYGWIFLFDRMSFRLRRRWPE